MNKPRPNRLGMYADVKEILDAALQSQGGEYTLADYGKAVHWRQRAYRFRKLFAESLPSRELSPYDRLTIPRIAEGSGTVIIAMQNVTGQFTPNAAPSVTEPPADDLLDEALALSERLSKGDPL